MTGKWPPFDVDHKNGITSDNRFENLRLATRAQNRANVGKTSRNSTGFKGVKYSNRGGAYVANIGCGGKKHYLGHFPSAKAAYEAYCVAADRMHGEFANVGSDEARNGRK